MFEYFERCACSIKITLITKEQWKFYENEKLWKNHRVKIMKLQYVIMMIKKLKTVTI